MILVAGAAAFSVTAVGCGDDDDPITPITTEATTPEASGPSDADFVASADPVCAEANAAIANLSAGTEVSSVAAGQQLEITQGLIESLQALGDPADPDGSLAEYYASLEDQVAVLEQQEEAAASGDTVTANALATELDAARNVALGAADDYGFEECGQEGTALPAGTEPGVTPPATPAPSAPVPEPSEPVAPVTPAEPVTPVEPAPEPVEPPPPAPTGGTDTGEGGSTGGTSGGSSGGVGPG